jgi:hypothetical protein
MGHQECIRGCPPFGLNHREAQLGFPLSHAVFLFCPGLSFGKFVSGMRGGRPDMPLFVRFFLNFFAGHPREDDCSG